MTVFANKIEQLYIQYTSDQFIVMGDFNIPGLFWDYDQNEIEHYQSSVTNEVCKIFYIWYLGIFNRNAIHV